jgi:hypothetical protein
MTPSPASTPTHPPDATRATLEHSISVELRRCYLLVEKYIAKPTCPTSTHRYLLLTQLIESTKQALLTDDLAALFTAYTHLRAAK